MNYNKDGKVFTVVDKGYYKYVRDGKLLLLRFAEADNSFKMYLGSNSWTNLIPIIEYIDIPDLLNLGTLSRLNEDEVIELMNTWNTIEH